MYNYFVVVALCFVMWLLQTSLSLEIQPHETVYIKNGTNSVDLPCGEVPVDAIAIEWFIRRENEIEKVLKLYPHIPGRVLKSFYGYTPDKFDISECVNTSLVVKNISLSDSGHYICVAYDGLNHSRHITLLLVVGK